MKSVKIKTQFGTVYSEGDHPFKVKAVGEGFKVLDASGNPVEFEYGGIGKVFKHRQSAVAIEVALNKAAIEKRDNGNAK